MEKKALEGGGGGFVLHYVRKYNTQPCHLRWLC